MIIDGKKLQKNITEELISRIQGKVYILDIIYVGNNPVIETYINAKKRFGEKLGITVRVGRLGDTATLTDINNLIRTCEQDSSGMIIQLPLPQTLDTKTVLELVDPSLDIDILSETAYSNFLKQKNHRYPPVLQAILYALDAYNINLANMSICVLGNGRLVGRPIADYLQIQKLSFIQMTKSSFDVTLLRNADIIFTGMGAPHIVTKDMVKDGVIIIDAGTSEEGGTVLGDVHPDVSEKARYFTPVPGGIGPLTVTALFNNLITPYEL
jgi:methylenetetrahydrofolate dehydrogenase (NADP+)/methenyltetrahydrofolate cyclohydrolase